MLRLCEVCCCEFAVCQVRAVELGLSVCRFVCGCADSCWLQDPGVVDLSVPSSLFEEPPAHLAMRRVGAVDPSTIIPGNIGGRLTRRMAAVQ